MNDDTIGRIRGVREVVKEALPDGITCPAAVDFLEAVALDIGAWDDAALRELVRIYAATTVWGGAWSFQMERARELVALPNGLAARPDLLKSLQEHVALLGDLDEAEAVKALCRETEGGGVDA